MNRQTLIPVSAEAEHSFDSFHAGGNAELLAELQRIVRGLGSGSGPGRVLYFWGEAGSGKTHLLNACCHLARTLGKPHAYLPMLGRKADSGPDPAPDPLRREQLEQIDPQSLVCIDDFHAIAGAGSDSDSWQAALFGLYEKLITHAGAMVVGAHQAIGALNPGLKDLKSRLLSGGVYRLARLTEQDKLAALQSRARHKGFELNDQALQFILTYYRRDPASLFALLDRIDAASLAEQRKITVPFIKSLL